MKYEKVVCWGADPEFQKRVSEEFTSSEIVLVLTLEDFKKAVTNTSLNLICSTNFKNHDEADLTMDVQAFVRSRPEIEFNIISYMGRKENSVLSVGYLWREENVEDRWIVPEYKGTIDALLQVSFKEDQL